MGISIGCSASGERLVSAARDGDLQETQALLDYNPRLANYSTFGGRNSPLHFAAMKGHNEIVLLLLEHGVEADNRNYCGQTALMQSCRHGHWEVVQTLILFNANVHKTDYLNSRTALHFAAVNGHARCIRLLAADYVPSVPYFGDRDLWPADENEDVSLSLNRRSLSKFINKPADRGITALHMAALSCHTDCVQLLLDLTADVSAVTFQYDTTMDMIGAGSSPLHYAACGGSIACCKVLLSRGANLNARNCNGWTPLQVARVWGRNCLESLLLPDSPTIISPCPPSRYLALPLMSIVKIARECGWRNSDSKSLGSEPCVVCLERNCTVVAEGCGHELCTKCALYLCSTNNGQTVSDPPGSIACPLCRHGITSFSKLATTGPLKNSGRSNLTFGLCVACTVDESESCMPSTYLHNKADCKNNRVLPVSTASFRTVTCPSFSGMNAPCGKVRENNKTEGASSTINGDVDGNELCMNHLAWSSSQIPILRSSLRPACLSLNSTRSKTPAQPQGPIRLKAHKRWWF